MSTGIGKSLRARLRRSHSLRRFSTTGSLTGRREKESSWLQLQSPLMGAAQQMRSVVHATACGSASASNWSPAWWFTPNDWHKTPTYGGNSPTSW